MNRAGDEARNEVHLRSRLPWWCHAAALIALGLVTVIRFYPQLTFPNPRTDERVYLEAFRAVADGRSPYGVPNDGLQFFYPPPFARIGAAALERANAPTVVAALRGLNVAGLAATLWCSFLFLPLGWRRCLGAAILFVVLAPVGLRSGFASGNLSFLVAGSALVGLAAWPRHPYAAGLLLAASSLVKPIAPLGVVALATHRPPARGRRHFAAAGVAIAVAAVLTLASPFLGDFLRMRIPLEAWPLRRSVSLLRWLHRAGLALPPVALTGLVALAAAVWARRRTLGPFRLFLLAIVAMTAATPALWSHTLILTLPLQVLALARAWGRFRHPDTAAAPYARFELALVVVGVAALQFADGIGGGTEVAPVSLQLAALAIPVTAPLAMAAYVWPRGAEAVGAA